MEKVSDKLVIMPVEEAIFHYDEGNYSVSLYIPPYGEQQINEVMDIVYYEKNYTVPYHYNDRGTETIMVRKGRVEVTMYGKACECDAGDFINIPAHCPYSLKTLDDGCLIRGVYTGLNMASKFRDLKLLNRNALPYIHKADFVEKEFYPAHYYVKLTEPVDVEKVEKSELPQITAKDCSIYEYAGWEGINCQLKVGRWNLKNVKEIWQFTIDRGYQLQFLKPNRNQRVYSVQSGQVRVEADGQIVFAERGDVIHISQYTPGSITAMEKNTVLHDYNVSAHLFRMLEMLELAQRDEPEKVADPEWRKWLLDMNDCCLTGFSMVETI